MTSMQISEDSLFMYEHAIREAQPKSEYFTVFIIVVPTGIKILSWLVNTQICIISFAYCCCPFALFTNICDLINQT